MKSTRTIKLTSLHPNQLSVFLSVFLALVAVQVSVAQDEDADEPLVVRMYQVEDLVQLDNNRPFTGFILPGVSRLNAPTTTGAGAVGLSGGLGGGGGGFFRVAPTAPKQGMGGVGMGGGGMGGFAGGGGVDVEYEMDILRQLIVDSVATENWDDYGGTGTIIIHRTVMVVSQTEAVHQQTEAFLALLRKTFKLNKSPVTIKAVWLTIDEDQLDSLKLNKNQTVDPAALKQLAKDLGRRSQITCFDGQTVHIAAGNLKSSIESVVPVVGQNDLESNSRRAIVFGDPSHVPFPQSTLAETDHAPTPKHVLAQVAANEGQQKAVSNSSKPSDPSPDVGYQPVARWINYGTLLEVTPKIESDNSHVQLDLTSILTASVEAAPAVYRDMSIQVDRHDLNSQQFQTSVRLKESTPTLVGGAAIVPNSRMQTYLILEVVLGGE